LAAKTIKDFAKVGEVAPHDSIVHLTAHMMLLMLSEWPESPAGLNSTKSDLANAKWVSGLKPALANCNRVVALVK